MWHRNWVFIHYSAFAVISYSSEYTFSPLGSTWTRFHLNSSKHFWVRMIYRWSRRFASKNGSRHSPSGLLEMLLVWTTDYRITGSYSTIILLPQTAGRACVLAQPQAHHGNLSGRLRFRQQQVDHDSGRLRWKPRCSQEILGSEICRGSGESDARTNRDSDVYSPG